MNTLLTSYQLLSEKNQANGYAGLDGSGKIDATLLPISVTGKVSADGSVTTHNDVTNAGSGQIITNPERTLLGNAIQPGDNISDLNNDAGYVVRPTFNVNLNNAESSVSRTVSGGRTIFTITHNLNTLDVTAQVFRLADGRDINWRVERSSVNAIEVSRAGNIANNLYRVLIST